MPNDSEGKFISMPVCLQPENGKLRANRAATLAATFPSGIAANYAVGDVLPPEGAV